MIYKFENPWDENSTKEQVKNKEKQKVDVNKEKSGFFDNKDIFSSIKKLLSSESSNNNRGSSNKNNLDQNNGFKIFKSYSRKGFLSFLFIIGLVWLATGFYTLDINEQGVVTRFGKFSRIAERGLNYKLPSPIEDVERVNVTRINRETIGVKMQKDTNTSEVNKRSQNSNWQNKQIVEQNKLNTIEMNVGGDNQYQTRRNSNSYQQNIVLSQDKSEEGQMLAGDETMIDIQFYVQWYIDNPKDYIINIKDDVGDNTVRVVSESAMRSVIGTVKLYDALSEKRDYIERSVMDMAQKILDQYDSGIKIKSVGILYSYVAPEVMDAYRDVQAAKADREREINEAYAYRNGEIPKARGEAQSIIEAANAYKESAIAKAKGEAERYVSVYKEYTNSKDVVKQRMYIDTLSTVISSIDKILIDSKSSGSGGSANGILPVVGLNELMKNKMLKKDESTSANQSTNKEQNVNNNNSTIQNERKDLINNKKIFKKQ